MDVLRDAGFNPTSRYTSRKRFESVAYVNVKTDVPDWLGAAGKTHMNQLPYAATIAKTLVTMVHKIPSYHGQGFALDSTPSSITIQKTATEYVDEFLIQSSPQWNWKAVRLKCNLVHMVWIDHSYDMVRMLT
jgi:hypothetical protein